MKNILPRLLVNFANILFYNIANQKTATNFELEANSPHQNVDEMQQYLVNRNLRHIEYINQLEKQIEVSQIQGFSQDFYDELKSSKLICKINTINTTRKIA